MGTKVPPGWPKIEDDKWYKVTEHAYEGVEFDPGCVGPIVATTSCCVMGNVINANLAIGYQCKWFLFLCVYSSPHPKRLIGVVGPYGTKDACLLTL